MPNPSLVQGPPATDRSTGKALLEHYQMLFEHARDIILFVRLEDGCIIDANRAAEQAYGYTREELLTLHIADLRALGTHALIGPQMEQADAGGILFETLHQRKNGCIFPVEVSSLGAAMDGERVNLSIIRDISERKSADQLLEKIFRSLAEVVLVQDPATRLIVQCSAAAERVLGYLPEELVGKTTACLYPTREIYEDLGRMIRSALDRDGVFHTEECMRRKDGREIFVDLSITEIQDDRGERVAIIGSIHDVTDRKRTEQALLESESRFRTLIEEAPVAIGMARDGLTVYANPFYLQMFGYQSLDELSGRPLSDQIAPGCREDILERARCREQSLAAETEFESVGLRKDGSQFPFHAAVTRVDLTDGPATIAFFTDITQRKQAEEALLERERQLDQIIQQMPFPVEINKPDGTVMAVNQAFLEMYGSLSAPLVFGMFNVFNDPYMISSGLLEQIWPAYQGKTIFLPEVEVQLRAIEPGCQPERDGTKYHDITVFPVLQETGEVWRVVTIWKDITERRAAERELERRLAELEALHAVALAGTESDNLEQLLVRIATILGDRLFTHNIGIGFYDEDSGRLTFHPAAKNCTGDIDVSIPVDLGITGWVARHRTPRRVEDVHQEPDYLASNPGCRSELCVPITVGEVLIGVINVESQHLSAFSEADERLLTAVAGEMGTAVEKIRLLEAERNRRRELEVLAELSAAGRAADTQEEILPAVLHRIRLLLGARGAAIAFCDPRDEALVFELGSGDWEPIQGTRIPKGGGIGDQVASSQQLYLSSEATSDPRLCRNDLIGSAQNLLCLPLIADGVTIGLLFLGHDAAFLPGEVGLAQAAVDIITSAIHRVRLHERTERALQRLIALRVIDQSILSTPDLEKTLHILLEQITSMLQLDAANFLLYDPQLQILNAAAERGLPAAPVWDLSSQRADTHAGRVALSLEMEFIPDLTQIEDSLTAKLRQIGESFRSYIAMPLVAKGELKGVLQLFHRTRLEPSPDWMDFLQALADQAAIAIDSARLYYEQQQTNHRLAAAYDDTIEGWSRALDLRDQETEGHSRRVTELTLRLAKRMGLPEAALPHIRRGAHLHDIGKMGVPDSILLKPGPLTGAEWEIMHKHPLYALDLLYPIDFLQPALEIPAYHHEKWDGSGYPQGLKGEEIPLPARIFALVDVWDAITSDRPYRPALSRETALKYIREQSGYHFDPAVVKEFLELVDPASKDCHSCPSGGRP